MKKFFVFSGLIILLSVGKCFAEVNLPSAPTYPRSNTALPSSSVSSRTNNFGSIQAQLNSLSMSVLKAAENRNDSEMQKYMTQMLEKGVTGMCQPQVIAKQTPTCPPIRLEVNGKKMSGSMCAYTCYEYEGRQYDVGYCK